MRSYRELWLWLGGLFLALAPLLAGIGIAYFAKEIHYSLFTSWWIISAWISFVLAFTCFFGAIRAWKIPPWRKTSFPDLFFDMYGRRVHIVDANKAPGVIINTKLLVYTVTITNNEDEQNASLTVRLQAKLRPGSFGPFADTIYTTPKWRLPDAPGFRPLDMPIPLPPRSAVGGDLVYEIEPYTELKEPFEADLIIMDHITGKIMKIPAVMGKYGKGAMVPTTGLVEMLGSEYETQTK